MNNLNQVCSKLYKNFSSKIMQLKFYNIEEYYYMAFISIIDENIIKIKLHEGSAILEKARLFGEVNIDFFIDNFFGNGVLFFDNDLSASEDNFFYLLLEIKEIRYKNDNKIEVFMT